MRELLVVPDERLRQKSEAVVDPSSAYVRELAGYMLECLEPMGAGAFAAPQFGEMVRLFVARIQGIEIILANPQITKQVGQHIVAEGCMSIPGKIYLVRRPKLVKAKGLNLDGHIMGIKGHGLLAQVLRHEIDHLDGIMIDKIGERYYSN